LFLMYADMAINFPLRIAFAVCPIGSDKLCFHFQQILGTFWFPPLFLLWSTDCWAICCSTRFEYFLLLLLLLISSCIALLSGSMQGVISIFLYFLSLALCP
jgi:hypothetical protein